MSHFEIEGVDNQDGTRTLLVDSVQLGPPFPWDDLRVEHYVRLMAQRAETHIPTSHKLTHVAVPWQSLIDAGSSRIEVVPMTDEEVAESMNALAATYRGVIQQPNPEGATNE